MMAHEKAGGKPEQVARIRGSGNRVYQQVIQLNSEPEQERRYAVYSSTAPSSLPDLEHSAMLADSTRRRLSAAASACLTWIAKAQNPDGGLPTDDHGTPSCTWTTAGLLWASSCYGVDTNAAWSRRAGAWLLDQLSDDGGLPTVRVGDPTTTDATAQALLAAINYVDDGDPRFPRIARWLIHSQDDAGGWSWLRWDDDPRVASTSFAILALQAYSRSCTDTTGDASTAVAAAVRWLQATQNSDGGWGDVPAAVSRPSSTGLATLALSSWPGTQDHRMAAGDFITDAFDDGWVNGLERPSSHTIIRLGIPYAMLGLTSTPHQRHFETAAQAVPHLLRDYLQDCFVLSGTRTRSWPTRDGLLAIGSLLRAGVQ